MSHSKRRASFSRRAALAAVFAVGLQLALPGRAHAEEGPEAAAPRPPAVPVDWASLTAEEQKALARFSDRWSTLPADKQQRLLRGTRRWLAMSPEERERAQARYQRWEQLSPEERELARRRWHHYREMSPEQRERIRDGYHRFKKLSPEQKRRLRERWQNATPEERQKWLERRRQRQERQQGG